MVVVVVGVSGPLLFQSEHVVMLGPLLFSPVHGGFNIATLLVFSCRHKDYPLVLHSILAPSSFQAFRFQGSGNIPVGKGIVWGLLTILFTYIVLSY